MVYGTHERVAHVVRRAGMGPHPDELSRLDTVDDALSWVLTAGPQPGPPEMDIPSEREEARDPGMIAEPLRWWLGTMATTKTPLVERLIWFWHDHFATGLRKVRIPYVMWNQHRTIRRLATTSFRDLLRAIATDPAMLLYLDGLQNAAGAPNENFAREVMELHTMGPGNYSQSDVTEVARACTGWVVNIPYQPRIVRASGTTPAWQSFFFPPRHDDGEKTFLGRTGRFDIDDVVETLLAQPATARFVAGKLFAELVGRPPSPPELEHVISGFDPDYRILPLVERILHLPAFISDGAIRSKVRTPVERLIGVLQGFGDGEVPPEAVLVLHGLAYLPFNPPSPAGFPSGLGLLGPYQLTHAFDLLRAVPAPDREMNTDEALARLGLTEVSDSTRRVVDAATTTPARLALACNSPEYALI